MHTNPFNPRGASNATPGRLAEEKMSTPFEKAKAEVLAALPVKFEELLKEMRWAPAFLTASGCAVGMMRLNGRDVQVQLKFEADPEEFMGESDDDVTGAPV